MMTNCTECLNSTVCLKCSETSYLNIVNKCSTCGAVEVGCVECLGPNYCTKCKEGFVVD